MNKNRDRLVLKFRFAGKILVENAIVVSVRDITERKRAQEAAEERLRESEKFRGP